MNATEANEGNEVKVAIRASVVLSQDEIDAILWALGHAEGTLRQKYPERVEFIKRLGEAARKLMV